jgi:hypothetical protein
MTMARIDIDQGDSQEVTIYNMVGAVGVDDFVAAMNDRQQNRGAGKAMLDITEACLCHLENAEIRRAIDQSRLTPRAPGGGRIAIVAPLDTSLKVLKFCAAISSGPCGVPGSFHFVADRDEAIAWLSD